MFARHSAVFRSWGPGSTAGPYAGPALNHSFPGGYGKEGRKGLGAAVGSAYRGAVAEDDGADRAERRALSAVSFAKT